MLERVSMLVGDSSDAYTPKTIFYAELAVYDSIRDAVDSKSALFSRARFSELSCNYKKIAILLKNQ